MDINKSAVEKAMSQGAPITCSTCSYFHEGSVVEGSMVCGQTECGGPGVGKDFPQYDGPIPRENLAERCLVCGEAPGYLIVGLKTRFSLCKKHRKVFDYVGTDDPDKVQYPVRVIAIP